MNRTPHALAVAFILMLTGPAGCELSSFRPYCCGPGEHRSHAQRR